VFDNVGGHEAYSFIDGFSGYHQIKIMLEDRSKMTFAIEWGYFQYTVMSFELKNAPMIFFAHSRRCIQGIYSKFLEVYFDDWTVFVMVKFHVESLHLMLDTCGRY